MKTTGVYPRVHVGAADVAAIGDAGGVVLTGLFGIKGGWGSEAPGFEQAACEVVREVPEAERGAAEMLEPTVVRGMPRRPEACYGAGDGEVVDHDPRLRPLTRTPR